MRESAPVVLFVIAVILWFLAAIEWPETRVSLGWLGAFFAGLAVLFGFK
jgi:hypothetical protein